MEQETPLWTGTPSHYTNLKWYVGCVLFAIFWVYICILQQDQLIEKQVNEGQGEPVPASFFVFLMIGLISPLVIGLWQAWKVRSTHYSLTSQRLIVSHGIFSRRIDELELYRIKDYRIEQSLFERLLHLGTIILETSDRSDHVIWLEAITEPEKVRDLIRTGVEDRRKHTGARISEVEVVA